MKMPRSGIALLLCALLSGATGCGQQGPLYLPDPSDEGELAPDEDRDENEDEEDAG